MTGPAGATPTVEALLTSSRRAEHLEGTAQAWLMLAVGAGVVAMHLVGVVVLAVTGAPGGGSAVVALTAVPWAVSASWAAWSLRRRTGVSSTLSTAALAVGAVAVALDGALTPSPGQDVLCAAGLTGIALAISVVSSPRGVLVGAPVVLGSQLLLLVATQGTSAAGWYVALSTVATTAGVVAVASWLQAQRREGLTVLARLAEGALEDPLTGLLNRRGMTERFGPLRAAAPSGQRAAVIALDLDHFKRVNDALGHDAGDRTLVAVADVLRSQARAGDLVVRLGGEELAWIGTWDDEASVAVAADRLRRGVGDAELPHGLHLTVSAGVAFSTDATQASPDDEALSRLLVRSDAALYRAKAGGRDRVAVAGAAVPAGAGSPDGDPHHDRAPVPQLRDGGSGVGTAGATGADTTGQRA